MHGPNTNLSTITTTYQPNTQTKQPDIQSTRIQPTNQTTNNHCSHQCIKQQPANQHIRQPTTIYQTMNQLTATSFETHSTNNQPTRRPINTQHNHKTPQHNNEPTNIKQIPNQSIVNQIHDKLIKQSTNAHLHNHYINQHPEHQTKHSNNN